MAISTFLLAGILMTGICLELSLAAPSPNAGSKVGIEGEVNDAADATQETDTADIQSKHPAAVAVESGEKSISPEFKQPRSSSPSGLVKRDVEQEADSANGKTPFYLFKKNFYHPNTRRFLSSNANEKDYSLFPPFTGAYSGGVRYQRHRRSFQTHPTDELEVQLGNERDKEAFLRLMALLYESPPKDSSQLLPYSNYNNMLNHGGYLAQDKEEEDDEGTFQDDENNLPLDLGFYGGIAPGDLFHQYQPTYELDDDGSGSGIAGDLTRMGIHLNQLSPATRHALSLPKNKQQDIEDDWLEDAIPLHLKRSDNSAYFRYNPVKSHFRRYLRSGSSIGPSSYNSNYNDDNGGFGESFTGGRFGSFYPSRASMLIRKRRSFNPTKIAPFTM